MSAATMTSSPVLHDVRDPGTPGVPDVAAGEDKLPTVDPESIDATRPVDLDTCTACDGLGEIQIGWAGDPHEFDGEPCSACGGTGQRGAA